MMKRLDLGIIVTVSILCVVGFILVLSSSSYYALSSFDDAFYFARRHAAFIIVGLVIMFFIRVINYRILDNMQMFVILNTIAIALASSIFIIGSEKLGATRWITIGSIEFMPVDIAKGAVVFSLAYTLSHFRASRKGFLAMFLHLIVPGLLIFLIALQPDYSSSFVLAGATGIVMLIAFEPVIYVLLLGAVGAVGAFFLARSASYRMDRINSFLASLQNIHGAEDQIKYGIFAISTGGVIGKGPGRSLFNKLYIPHPHNDMILSTLGEEYGFLGMFFVFIVYLILLLSLTRLAIKTRDPFGKIFVTGVTATIFIQLTVNVGSTLGLMPPTGISLPFISYGGTNMVIFLMMMGVCLSVYRMER